MPLYLVRHGQAYPETFDVNRALTEEGRATVDRTARLASEFISSVSQIIHSGKTRAGQTAEIMAHYFKPSFGVKEVGGINPNDDVMKIAKILDPSNNTMLVGHLPFLERIVSYLITGEIDKTIIRIQTGGIVCLDKDPATGDWYIKWALMPE